MRNLISRVIRQWFDDVRCFFGKHYFILITENTNGQPYWECPNCFVDKDEL